MAAQGSTSTTLAAIALILDTVIGTTSFLGRIDESLPVYQDSACACWPHL